MTPSSCLPISWIQAPRSTTHRVQDLFDKLVPPSSSGQSIITSLLLGGVILEPPSLRQLISCLLVYRVCVSFLPSVSPLLPILQLFQCRVSESGCLPQFALWILGALLYGSNTLLLLFLVLLHVLHQLLMLLIEEVLNIFLQYCTAGIFVLPALKPFPPRWTTACSWCRWSHVVPQGRM